MMMLSSGEKSPTLKSYCQPPTLQLEADKKLQSHPWEGLRTETVYICEVMNNKGNSVGECK